MSDLPKEFSEKDRANPPADLRDMQPHSPFGRRKSDRLEYQSKSAQLAISALLETSVENLSMEKQLKTALDIILSVPWLAVEDKGSIFLVDDNSEDLVMLAQRNLDAHLLVTCARIKPGFCLCGQAAKNRTSVFSSHMDEQHSVVFEGIKPHGHYCIPIIFHDQLLGVLNLYVVGGYERNAEEEAFLVSATHTLGGIIQRRIMERKLDEQMAYTKALINYSLDMIIAVDEKWHIVEFNPAAQKAFGYKLEEIIGEPLRRLFYNINQADMIEAFTSSQGRFSREVVFKRRSDETFPAFFSCGPLLNDKGVIIGAVSNSRDITAEKKIQALMKARLAQPLQKTTTQE